MATLKFENLNLKYDTFLHNLRRKNYGEQKNAHWKSGHRNSGHLNSGHPEECSMEKFGHSTDYRHAN